MANCILCSTELKFGNTPLFGKGKLSGEDEICTTCFKKIVKVDRKVALKLKNYSVSDVKKLLQENEVQKGKESSRIEEVKTEIKNLQLDNVYSFLGRKEIKELPQILADSESIDGIIQGMYQNGQGILVSTNRRLVFIDKGLIYGLKIEDFPLNKISSIQYETGLMLGKVKIYTSGNIATIKNVEKSSARKFAEFVRDKLSQENENVSPKNSEPDVLEQLEKLGRLKEKGILSKKEFQEQKRKLLK